MTIPVLHDTFETRPRGDAGAVLPSLSKLFHWITALLVFVMFCTGVTMKQIGDGAIADALDMFHKTSGATLLLLVALRLCYRGIAHLTGRWRKGVGSRLVHACLYAGLVLVPLLGMAGASDLGVRGIYFGLHLPAIWPEGAGQADLLFRSHAWLAFALIALVAVHIGVALNDYIQRGTGRTDDE